MTVMPRASSWTALIVALFLGVFTVEVPAAPTVRSTDTTCHAHSGLPDRSCTPGVRDPHVTQKNLGKTICRSGYTDTVRPPSSYTTKLKKKQMKEYGYYAGKKTSSYEEDHLMSLELGGSPRDPNNLWPEAYKPKPGARQKDTVENYLHRQVCAGDMKLVVAQRREAKNWVKIYRQTHR